MRTALPLLLALLALAPATGRAQLAATFGPRGELSELRAGGTVYVTDAAVAIIQPGWTGDAASQRTVPPSDVTVRKAAGATVYTATLAGPKARVRMREVARVAPGAITLSWELTAEQDVPCETVLVQCLVPAAAHAGRTRYLLGDADGVRGTCPAALDADRYQIFGGRPAAWLGLACPGAPALRVEPAGMTFQFQDNRKWDVPAFGLLAMAGSGKLAAGRTLRFGLTFRADTAARLEADARALGQGGLANVKYADTRPLKVTAAADRHTVEAYGMVEVTADVAARYDNPFDPEQVAVDAEVRTPGGKTVTVPGFYCVPMRLETTLGVERVRTAGKPSFRVRYAPPAPGRYRLVVKATDRTGTVRAAPIELTATAARSDGFVRAARRSPHYFALDSGKPYFAVGENVCWSGARTPIADYTKWFHGLGAAGGNWARLWLAFNEKGLEWMPAPTPKPGIGSYLGLGRYAQDNAWRLDQVVRLARENGIRAMFCLGTYGEFTEGGYFGEGSWASNPYNTANGGPCARPADFWTDERARKLYKQRLRYVVARWGYSPDVFAWEFWNEVPATPPQAAWVAEMAAYLKRIDPNRHLVSTTYGSPAVWRCPDVDFTMQHMYGQAGNTADFTERIVANARPEMAYGKPYLLAEFGIDWQTGDNRWDPHGTGVNMHNGAWASLMSGAAGTAMLWYWDGYVHPSNLYHILTPVRRFADTVDWARTPLLPLEGITLEAGADEPASYADITVPSTVEWGASPSSRYTLRHDGTVEGGPVSMTIGSPQRADPRELHSKLTWVLDMPRAGRVTLRLGSVSSAAHLLVTLDGKTVVDRELLAGEPGKGPWKSSVWLSQYRIWQSDYAEDIPVEVPEGRHELAIANTGGDWLQIRSIAVPAYRSSRYPDVDALGLQGGRLTLLWLHNRPSTWRTDYDGKQPPEVRGLRVSVPVADGAWRVEWWDTWRGVVLKRETVRAEAGHLSLTATPFARDLALRCERAR